jgi:hypothetical protein
MPATGSAGPSPRPIEILEYAFWDPGRNQADLGEIIGSRARLADLEPQARSEHCDGRQDQHRRAFRASCAQRITRSQQMRPDAKYPVVVSVRASLTHIKAPTRKHD